MRLILLDSLNPIVNTYSDMCFCSRLSTTAPSSSAVPPRPPRRAVPLIWFPTVARYMRSLTLDPPLVLPGFSSVHHRQLPVISVLACGSRLSSLLRRFGHTVTAVHWAGAARGSSWWASGALSMVGWMDRAGL